jgi:hypothetical protein
MTYNEKVEKIRKDCEIVIGKNFKGNDLWKVFKASLLIKYPTEEQQLAFKLEAEVQIFLKAFGMIYPTLKEERPKVKFSDEDLAEFRKAQEEKAKRIAAHRERSL